MAGIYIHIPYCRQKCHYCNFFSVASGKQLPETMDAICEEALLQKNYLKGLPIDTLYFGGGTPSLINSSHLNKILETLTSSYSIAPGAEITLEANPDDITQKKLDEWKAMGINRLSIGVQSFRDEDLKYLNRVHNSNKALECIQQAQTTGFHNLTIDLIYGIPTLTTEAWMGNLEITRGLEIPHISAYALTVEPRTALEVMIRKGKYAPVDEAQSVSHFKLLVQFMQDNGFLHYEISNFCLPGSFARHNTAYWQGEPYLGLGPSAHSFSGNSRQWNVSGISEYIHSISERTFPIDSEQLTKVQLYNEYVMTGLRTMWGCNAHEIRQRFGEVFYTQFTGRIRKFIDSGLVTESDQDYKLTLSGKLFADGLASDLFITDGH
ncbi:MAG: radical SAM family heme chaperone HemW [Lentimicrobium sp.]|nr:radical SAM family heme chaperone HemW [Lentimicrobium sp.]